MIALLHCLDATDGTVALVIVLDADNRLTPRRAVEGGAVPLEVGPLEARRRSRLCSGECHHTALLA